MISQLRQSAFFKTIGNKNFRHLWFAQIFSQIGSNMLLFVLVLRIYQTTVSNTAVSGLILAFGLPSLIFGVLAGVYVDRLEKREVLVWCNILRVICAFGFFLSMENVLWIYLLTILTSIITQFFIPAEAPSIPRLVEKEYLFPANSLFNSTFYTSAALGYLSAGLFLKFFGPQNIFLFIAFLFFLAAFFTSRLPKLSSQEENFRSFFHVRKELLEGYKYIREKGILEVILVLTVFQTLISVLMALAPGIAHRLLEIDISDASLILLGPAVSGIIFISLVFAQIRGRFNKEKLLNRGIFLAGGVLLILSLFYRLKRIPLFENTNLIPSAMLLLFLLGLALGIITVPATTDLQEKTTDEVRGRIYGILTAATGGAALLPVILAGVLADNVGIGRVIFLLSLLTIGYGAYRTSRA